MQNPIWQQYKAAQRGTADLELHLLERSPLPDEWVQTFDARLTEWMARYGITLLRVGLGVIFLWFGALKFIPGGSPAEQLVKDTIYFVPPDLFYPVLAAWETLIGIGLITGLFPRLTLLLLFLQMPGTALPLVLLPSTVWSSFPFELTLEGQYIIKNLVLVAAGLVIGSTVRGGRIVANPEAADIRHGEPVATHG